MSYIHYTSWVCRLNYSQQVAPVSHLQWCIPRCHSVIFIECLSAHICIKWTGLWTQCTMAPHSGVAVYLPYLITTGEANKQLVLIF